MSKKQLVVVLAVLLGGLFALVGYKYYELARWVNGHVRPAIRQLPPRPRRRPEMKQGLSSRSLDRASITPSGQNGRGANARESGSGADREGPALSSVVRVSIRRRPDLIFLVAEVTHLS